MKRLFVFMTTCSRSLGSHWDDDRPLPADWLERDVTKETQACLMAVLKRDFRHASLLGLKDPRMSRLMPLWFPIFDKLAIEPHFALTVRQSFEVARSLAKRDGLEPAKSYLLWLGHIFAAEAATRGHKRAFVQYDGDPGESSRCSDRVAKRIVS